MCLEAGGCARLRARRAATPRPARGYRERAGCACGGPDKVRLVDEGDALRCPCCGERYPVVADGGYVDLVPRASVGERDPVRRPRVPRAAARDRRPARALRPRQGGHDAADAGPAGRASPCSTSAAARARWRSTPPRAAGARPGIDLAPFFLPRAAPRRRARAGRPAAAALPQGQLPARLLARRARAPRRGRGAARCSPRRAAPWARRDGCSSTPMPWSPRGWPRFQRAVNRLARRLGERGLIDHEREAMRKSDHVNAIRSHEHFDALCASAGPGGRGAPVLQRRLQGGGGGPAAAALRAARGAARRREGRRAPRRTTTATRTARHGRIATRAARAALVLGRRPRPHLAPEARRGPLRRHPHRPLLRPAASARRAA